MASSIFTALTDLMADTVSAQFGTKNTYGTWVASGDATNMTAYIAGSHRLVRDVRGQETVSTFRAIVGPTPDLVTSSGEYRFTLPARYSPRSNLQAISIGQRSDENGAHHQVVFFP